MLNSGITANYVLGAHTAIVDRTCAGIVGQGRLKDQFITVKPKMWWGWYEGTADAVYHNST